MVSTSKTSTGGVSDSRGRGLISDIKYRDRDRGAGGGGWAEGEGGERGGAAYNGVGGESIIFSRVFPVG